MLKDHSDYIIEQFKAPNCRTLQDIGDEFNVSREAIRLILKKHGVSSSEGGMHARARQRREEVKARVNQRYRGIYGCDEKTVKRINKNRPLNAPNSPARRYRTYLSYLRNRRGIPYSLSLKEWYDIWEKSGHFDSDEKYNMVRIDETKPVTADNVRIISQSAHAVIVRTRDYG